MACKAESTDEVVGAQMNMNVQVVGQHFYSKLLFVLLAAIVAQYVYIIMSYPLFSFSDEAEFIPYLLGEGHYPWRYFPEYGRCYFLSLMEYFPVAALDIFSVKEKMFLMYCINSVKIGLIVILIMCCFRKLANEFLAFVSLCITMLLMIKFGLFTTILTLTYPEFTLVLLFVCFTLFYINGVIDDSAICFACACAVSFVSLFFKETASLLYVVFVCARLISGRSKISRVERRFLYCIFAIVASYFLFFFFAVYSNKAKDFYPATEKTFIENFFIASRHNFILIPSLLVMLFRLYQVFVRKFSAELSDVFVTVSFFYALPFVYMGLAASYYFSPCVFFFMAAMLGYSSGRCSFLSSGVLLKCLVSFLFAMGLLVSNYYYTEYKSEQYTLKKTTLPLLEFVASAAHDGVSQQFVTGNVGGEKADAFAHMVAMWFFNTLNDYERLYFLNEDAIVSWRENAPRQDTKEVYYFYDQEGQWKPQLAGDFVLLDFVFVQALVSKACLAEILPLYGKFYRSVKESRIRPLNMAKVDAAFKAVQRD